MQAPLEDEDAIVVARQWLFRDGLKKAQITMDDIEDEIACLGLESLPKGKIRIRFAIVHLGNELVAKNYVKLSKVGGLQPHDVVIDF